MRQMMTQVRKMFGGMGGGGGPFGMGMPNLGGMDLSGGLPGLFGGGGGAAGGRPGMPQGMPQLPMRPPKGPPKGGPPSGYYRKKKKR